MPEVSPASLETRYRDALEHSPIPGYMHGGIVRYLLHGIPPGDFLAAVLSNDLREAVSRVDDTNQPLITAYVRFLWAHAPIASWGSADRVSAWIERHRAER